MRRLLLKTVALLTMIGLALTGSIAITGEQVQAGDLDCPTQGCPPPPPPPPPPLEDEDGGSGGPKPGVPPQKEAYCTDPAIPEFRQLLLNSFKTADDTTINSIGVGFDPTRTTPTPIVVPKIAIAQQVAQWCRNSAGVISRLEYFWVPLATPDSVALQAGLLAKVQGRLSMPEVVWLDIDKDNGWLWVNIDHHVSITPPVPVNESASDGNPVTGFATAWVKATPVSFTIELPKETGAKSTQLATCDLTEATSAEGCVIKFTHSSSISTDTWFRGRAKITWAVSSNSGKYNGVGPFTTSSEVRVQVAEMMAVSPPG